MTRSMSLGALALLAALVLAACRGQRENVVTAWPGMTVAEFNRLNSGGARTMSVTDSDWIGINSPVTLVFQQRGESVRFLGTRRGGGIQVASSKLTSDGQFRESALIQSIAFNIGGGMEDISALWPLLVERCRQLARMTGARLTQVPDAATISRTLETDSGPVRDAQVCSGRGEQIWFSISAAHPVSHWEHAGDFRWAFLDGGLGLVIGDAGP